MLTRIPVGAQIQQPSELAAAVPWFPVIGALVGVATAAVYAGARTFLPPLPAATLAVAAGALITGSLHEDGLGDVADAFFGGTTTEDRIRILKDPRLGTFGVVAVGLGLLLRTGVIASLDGWTALMFLTAAHSISRGGATFLMGISRPVAEPGLGASYLIELNRVQLIIGITASLVIGAVSIGVWTAPAAVLAAAGALLMGLWSARKIGGITGDVLGAAQQIGEMLILLLAAALFAGR